MEPIFIYFDKVKFDDSNVKTFTITFSDGDSLDGVFFKKTHDYYITSMSSLITIEKDLKESKDYDNIKKISEKANEYLKNGINHFKSLPPLSSSVFHDGIDHKKDLIQDETKEALSVVEISFIDLNTKKSNLVKVYSGYENLKLYGLKFSNADLTYNIDLISEKGELYINKKVTLRKSENLLINSVIRHTYSENLIMIKYNGRYQSLYLPVAKYYHNQKKALPTQRFEREILTHNFIYNSFFVDLTSYPRFIITFNEKTMSSQLPIFWGRTGIKIHPNTEIYFTPTLYEKLKSKLPFGSATVTLTDAELADVKSRNFFIKNKKFYTFVNTNPNQEWQLQAKDFVLINYKINITTDVLNKQHILNFNGDTKTKIVKMKSPKDIVQKLQSDELNFLQSHKINTRSLIYAYENFFLYDLENVIKSTFTTELPKEFNIYGLIYFSGEVKQNNRLHLIRPKSKLKFQLDKDIYKKEMKFELAKVHKKRTFNVVGDYISNFSMLRTEKYGIGRKRKKIELVDEISILGIQNSEFNVLNPIYISITSDAIISKLQLHRNNRFRFVLHSLLFSSNIVNDTDVIIVTSNGLTNTKQALITKNNQPILESTLGVCFLTEIPEWNIVKGASKRLQIVFSDSEDVNRNTNHLAFSFITKNIADLLQFSVTLLDGAGKEITFPTNETKLPILSFTIQIIK